MPIFGSKRQSQYRNDWARCLDRINRKKLIYNLKRNRWIKKAQRRRKIWKNKLNYNWKINWICKKEGRGISIKIIKTAIRIIIIVIRLKLNRIRFIIKLN